VKAENVMRSSATVSTAGGSGTMFIAGHSPACTSRRIRVSSVRISAKVP
jgi:hypothetical protein